MLKSKLWKHFISENALGIFIRLQECLLCILQETCMVPLASWNNLFLSTTAETKTTKLAISGIQFQETSH